MNMSRCRSACSLLMIFSMFASEALEAADPTPEELLKTNGLKRAGSMYVHESEAQVRKKTNDARLAYRELGLAHMQLAATQQGKMEMLEEFETQRRLINEQIAMIDQSMMSLTTPFGGGNNNFAYLQRVELNTERNALMNSLNQLSRRYDQSKNQANDPNVRKEIETEFKKREENQKKAVSALREAVDVTTKAYGEIDKNNDVKKAIDSLSKSSKLGKFKLGPSKEFLASVKFLEKMEKEDIGVETKASTSRPSSKTRKSTSKSRRPARSNPSTEMPEATGFDPNNSFER